MNKKVIDYLDKERVSALTTLLVDGTPHSATLHYSFAVDPFIFYFSVDKTSRKC